MADEPETTIEVLARIVDRHVAGLTEHFESVRVFVTVKASAGQNIMTAGISRGSGNAYAQQGQIEEWIRRQHRIAEMEEEDAREDGEEEEQDA